MVTAFEMVRRLDWLSFDAVGRAVSTIGEDVVSLVPDHWKHKFVPRTRVVLLDVLRGAQTIDATLPDGRKVEVSASHEISDLMKIAVRSRVVLRIDEGEVLSTGLKLPRRAVSRLDEVVATNIPVWTPFAADDLYFRARVAGGRVKRDGDASPTCDVELRCVPRATLVPLLSMLAGRSIDVDEVWLGKDQSFSCDLGSGKTKARRQRRRITLALAALAALQVCVLSTVYRMHQNERIAMLQEDLDRIRKAVHARAARARLNQETTRMLSAIGAQATGQESMAFALKQIAAVLPAGARYRELDITSAGDGSLTIVSGDRVDPVSIVAATGLLTVTEVNEMNGTQENDHIYAVTFKAVRSASAPD